jgi:hypothetical protein
MPSESGLNIGLSEVDKCHLVIYCVATLAGVTMDELKTMYETLDADAALVPQQIRDLARSRA